MTVIHRIQSSEIPALFRADGGYLKIIPSQSTREPVDGMLQSVWAESRQMFHPDGFQRGPGTPVISLNENPPPKERIDIFNIIRIKKGGDEPAFSISKRIQPTQLHVLP